MDFAGSRRLFRKKKCTTKRITQKRFVSIGCAPCTRAITQMKTSELDDGGGNPVIKNVVAPK
jgi:3'-phosphoadenosine 5'-phosphosulfate sulfotransferase (PAPS reductase)/FAD synthetase